MFQGETAGHAPAGCSTRQGGAGMLTLESRAPAGYNPGSSADFRT